jgi:N-acetylglucosamine kinase-like BadF-type ATPase
MFIGLDCGGSSCRAIGVDAEGAIVFQGQSGPANLVSTPLPRIRRNLSTALRGSPPANGICGCFAGLLTEQHRSLAVELLAEIMPEAKIHAEPDYAAAFYAANPGTTLCVIAGTGSLVCSKVDGQIQKGGGRGYLLGDEGSAYAYGRDALRHFLDDPSRATPELTEAVQSATGSLEPVNIISEVYRTPTPASTIAKLAKALGGDAMAGEAYALAAIERNTEALVTVVANHVARSHPQTEIAICLAGGLWKATAAFRTAFERQIRARMDGRVQSVERTNTPPVYGAVAIAKEVFAG